MSANRPSSILPQDPSHSPVTVIYPSAYPIIYTPLPSSSLSTPPPTGSQLTKMDGIPCLPYLLCLYVCQPGQTFLPGFPGLPVTRTYVEPRANRGPHIRGRPVFHRPPKGLRFCFLSGHPNCPIVHDRVHHHNKYGGGQIFIMCDPPWTLLKGHRSSAPPGIPW